MKTRVYDYGCYLEPDSLAVLEDLSKKAHRYYCSLMELEIEARNSYREIRRKHFPELGAIEDEIAALRKKDEEGDQFSKEDSLRLRALSVEARPLREEFKARMAPADAEYSRRSGKPDKELTKGKSRSEVRAMMLSPHEQKRRNQEASEQMLQEDWPTAWLELHALDRERREDIRELRSICGVPHGTYLAVEDAVKDALADSVSDPKIPRWNDGEGARKVGVQLVNPRRLKINDLGPRHGKSKGRNSVRRVATFSVDVGAGHVLKGEVVLHRPLPSDSKFLWAYLSPGHRWGKWKLQLTIKTAEQRYPVPTTGCATIKIGNEPHEDGSLTVANIVSGDSVEKITLPAPMLRRLSERPEHLRSVRDKLLNEVRGCWLDYFEGNLPDWQRDLCSRIERRKSSDDPVVKTFVHPSYWRAPWKMHRIAKAWVERLGLDTVTLWQEWKRFRFDASADLFASKEVTMMWSTSRLTEEQSFAWWMYTWTIKDRHLHAIESGTRARAIRHRKDFYRTVAHKIALHFKDVCVEKSELKEVLRRPKRGEIETPEALQKRKNAISASGYHLTQSIKHACGERCNVVTIAGTSRKAKKAVSAPQPSVN